jgi:hypothetical protein
VRYALSPYIKQICFVFKGLNIGYDKTIEEVASIKFFGIHIVNNLNWKKYI